jgi:hypothetical protein
MKLTQKRWFKVLLGPGLVLFCLVVSGESYRATAAVLFIPLIVSYVYFLWTSKTKWMRLFFVAFLVAAFLPVDVTLRNYPGPPRFVPLIIGAPREHDVELEERGEAVLAGCISRGNDPRWVLVW